MYYSYDTQQKYEWFTYTCTSNVIPLSEALQREEARQHHRNKITRVKGPVLLCLLLLLLLLLWCCGVSELTAPLSHGCSLTAVFLYNSCVSSVFGIYSYYHGGAYDTSNQNPRWTQTPVYTPIFTHQIGSRLPNWVSITIYHRK